MMRMIDVAQIPSGAKFSIFKETKDGKILYFQDEKRRIYPGLAPGNSRQRRKKNRIMMRDGKIPMRGYFREIYTNQC